MSVFDDLSKADGGYIFVSHSHNDIKKVRKIRNELESLGFEPLCFYLKCLSDDSEVEELIKREIDAREWFLFINSENSRKSKWVTLEREYIQSTNEKKIISVDLENENDIKATIKKMARNLRVCISYAHKDFILAARINEILKSKDYLTFFDQNLTSGTEWASEIADQIKLSSQDGCVLVLITNNFLRSQAAQRQIEFAILHKANIIPVIFGDVLEDRMPFSYQLLLDYHNYNLSEFPSDGEIGEMIDSISKSIIDS